LTLVIHSNVKIILGGRRSERKKWNAVIEASDAIIFVAALSQFNEVCFEDDKTNKMKECLELAKQLSSENFLPDVPMFLLLNKQDVFIEELKKDSISMAFPNCPKDLTRLHTPSIFLSPVLQKQSPFSNRLSFSVKPKSLLSMSMMDENDNWGKMKSVKFSVFLITRKY
jgi:GTPase SAR1 family protein